MINKILSQAKGVMLIMMLLLPVQHLAATDFTVGDLKYTFHHDNYVTVGAASKSISGDLVIPSKVSYSGKEYVVKYIVGFNGCTSLKSVTIPSSVEEIFTFAFLECSNLTSVTIPSSVKKIGTDAFNGCSSLSSITIPSSVTTLRDGAFENCTALTSVSILSKEISLGECVFQECTNLRQVVISGRVSSIGRQAFYNCVNLNSINLSEGITSIGYYAFYGCENLSKVTISEGSSIGESAFADCTSLKSVIIPSNVTLGKGAFLGCTGITNVTIQTGVKSIGESAFAGCTSLKSVVIPEGVTSIEAFSNCTSLNSVTLPSSIITVGGFNNCRNLYSINLPEGITTISPFAFNYSGLRNISLPSTVTSIGERAFYNLNYLHDVIIPEGVTSIGDRAFAVCGIDHLLIPNSVTTIGNYSFDNNIYLKIVLPSNISSLGSFYTYYDITIPFSVCNENLPSLRIAHDAFFMGNDLDNTGNFKNSTINKCYVKPSVYAAYKDNITYKNLNLNDSIPVTFPSDRDYITLCRDFDVDLRHVNDNLPAGVSPLKAYIVEGVEEGVIYMRELKYIPSRLKANEKGYKGMEEYVGVLLKGTPGYTYYYQMGEDDYSKGVDGQMTLEKALALSPTPNHIVPNTAKNAYFVGAAQSQHVEPLETVDGVTYKTYGLKNNEFCEYESAGWIPYNKAYLRIPVTSTSSSAKKLTLAFLDSDGTTSIEHIDVDKSGAFENKAKDSKYNLQGQRVDDSYHGIVIVNGHKYLKK